ncbi:hypothetical protein, partial [Lunatibacter salilacus]|uniref:hypothetical protein n=1 Tax=Lunatibacter salilacus TaxID=2483804 RepID=UPI0018FEE8C4
EVTRAVDAENSLATDLAAETVRATAAEGVLQANIETVQDNVDANKTAAETAISLKEDAANKSTDITLSDATNTKFPTELAVRTFVNASAAEGSGALSEEVARAIAAEEKLALDLEAETTRAIDAESTLSEELSAETDRAIAAETTLTTDLLAETIRATSAEDKLNADLSAETTRAIAAETTLTTDLLAETARATSAEGVLQVNIETVQDN